MRYLKKMVSFLLVTVIMIPVLVVNAAEITPWYSSDWSDYEEMSITGSYGVLWTYYDFADMYNSLPKTGYFSTGVAFSGTRYRHAIRCNYNYFVEASDVVYDNGVLTFDYTANVDLAPDENGATTYHSMFVLYYAVTGDARKYYANALPRENGRFRNTISGFEIIKYVAPGTVNGEAIINSGENVSVILPDNFDPDTHVIGYTIWRIENKEIKYAYEDDMETFPYVAEPESETAPAMIFDLSEYVTPEETTIVSETTAPEPEVTTAEPEVTTTEPEVTTTEPETTTTEPAVTTTEPEVTTTEPEVTTTEPAVTTTEPEVTTTEPEVTTTEPEVTTTAVVPPEPDFVRGDANGDGKVNLRDASQMLKYLAAWQGIKVQEKSCDLNGNGRVDLSDVSTTLKIIAGWDV